MFGLPCLLVRVTLGSLLVLCGGPFVLAQDEPLRTTTTRREYHASLTALLKDRSVSTERSRPIQRTQTVPLVQLDPRPVAVGGCSGNAAWRDEREAVRRREVFP